MFMINTLGESTTVFLLLTVLFAVPVMMAAYLTIKNGRDYDARNRDVHPAMQKRINRNKRKNINEYI